MIWSKIELLPSHRGCCCSLMSWLPVCDDLWKWNRYDVACAIAAAVGSNDDGGHGRCGAGADDYDCAGDGEDGDGDDDDDCDAGCGFEQTSGGRGRRMYRRSVLGLDKLNSSTTMITSQNDIFRQRTIYKLAAITTSRAFQFIMSGPMNRSYVCS